LQWQWTPLGYAINRRNLEIVKILLDKKADVEKTFVRGKSEDFVCSTFIFEKTGSK
jgi:ankyrin repeat protein